MAQLPNLPSLVVSVAIAVAPAIALAAVKVNFVTPDHYTDVGTPGGRDRARNLDEIANIFETLGERYLPAGQNLTIDVMDIDLAGRLEPWHLTLNDVRYMREI